MPVIQRSKARTFACRACATGAAMLLASCATIDVPRVPNVGGAGPPGIRTSEIRQLGDAPVRGEDAVFAFQPITGAPADMIYALEDLIEEEAKARNIRLVEPGDPDATYVVQGYVSAVGDPHSALMAHVWDVSDAQGNRLHRFSGQEVAPGSGSDPWSGVTRGTMADAARETVDAMAEWIRN